MYFRSHKNTVRKILQFHTTLKKLAFYELLIYKTFYIDIKTIQLVKK